MQVVGWRLGKSPAIFRAHRRIDSFLALTLSRRKSIVVYFEILSSLMKSENQPDFSK